MIHSFTARNFHSINEEITVDFVVDENSPNSPKYTRTSSGTKLSLVQALIGPNATGKTTVLRIPFFLAWLITRSFSQDPYDEAIPFKAFAGNEDKTASTDLGVTFEIDGDIYTYQVSLNQKRIVREELDMRSLTNSRVTKKRIFVRMWNPQTKSYDIEDVNFGLPEGYWRSKELQKASLISASSKFGHDYASRITSYWRHLESNMEDYRSYYGGAYQALRYFGRDEDSKKRAEREVRRYADLGINAFGKNGLIRHKFGEVQFDLGIDQESAGTRHYLDISKMLDMVLNKGGLAIIDEFDAYLHPQMFASLLVKFFDPEINKNNGQLLITTHNLSIFNLLDAKYQLLLTKKDKGGATKIERIRDRADANHLARYIGGAYGALPEIN